MAPSDATVRAVLRALDIPHVGLPAARVAPALKTRALAAPDRPRVLVTVKAVARRDVLRQPITARVGARTVDYQPHRPVGFESVKSLVVGDHAVTSWVGIGLAVASVILMPLPGIAKQRLADRLGSAATAGEGRQNMLCAYLAGALLIGLLGNALAGAWWLDPAVGLLIAGVAVNEGLEAWRGEGCCVSSPLDGAGFADDACDAGCCGTTPR